MLLVLQAVREDYYFQMYYDDLPIWGFIGKVEKAPGSEEHKYYIFTHVHFDINYNKDKVIEINVATDPNALVSSLLHDPIVSLCYILIPTSSPLICPRTLGGIQISVLMFGRELGFDVVSKLSFSNLSSSKVSVGKEFRCLLFVLNM